MNILNTIVSRCTPLAKPAPSLIEEKLDSVKNKQTQFPNGGLASYIENWKPDLSPSFDSTIPIETLWQIYHAACTTYDANGKLQPQELFYTEHLAPRELGFLYYILLSYIENQSNLSPEEIRINKHYLSMIERHILFFSKSNLTFVENFIFHLTSFGSPLLIPVIDWIATTLNPSSPIDLLIKKATNEPIASTNGGLISYADNFFSLRTGPSHPEKVSDMVKWQLFIAAHSSANAYGEVFLNPEFTVDYLNPLELSQVYQILHVYTQEEGKKNPQLLPINQRYLAKIENRFMFLYNTQPEKAAAFIAHLKEKNDNRLADMIFKFDKLVEISEHIGSSKAGALSLLDEFYQKIETYSDAKREIYFYCLLRIIDARFPDAQIYKNFFDFSQIHYISTAPDFEALRVLIKYFNEKEVDSFKYKGKLTNIITTNLDNFTSHLDSLENSDFIGEMKFMILHRGPVGGHYVPVFIKRTKNEVTAIITDAGPFESEFNGISIVIDLIRKSNLKNVTIFSFDPPRQGDTMSCSIASFRDILESYRYDLFAYVDVVFRKYKEKRAPFLNGFLSQLKLITRELEVKKGVYVIRNYPPSFMKLKQGTSYLDDYEANNLSAKTKIVASKPIASSNGTVRVDKTLRQVVTDHTIVNGSKKTNFYLRERAFKYFVLIAKTLLSQSPQTA